MRLNGHAEAVKNKSLEKVLSAWVHLNSAFFTATDDAAWWYNERASISILAAAAWTAGGVALEEFSTRKKERGEKERAGRADIFFKINGQEFSCEAKFLWMLLGARNPISYIERSLKVACADARCLNPNDGKRFGICFITIITPKNVKRLNEEIRALQKKIAAKKYDAFAWSFPTEARNLTFKKKIWRNARCYPGTFIILERCD